MNNNDDFANDLLTFLINNNSSKYIKKLIDGEPKNIDPVKEIPNPIMRLYGFDGAYNSVFFDSEDKLINWIKENRTNNGSICIMDYIGNFAGQNDVIRMYYKSGKIIYYCCVDEYGYGVYNYDRSVYKGNFVWEYNYGDISDIYSIFRDNGIVFKNDIYKELEIKRERLLEYCRENNLFNNGK